MNTGEMLGVMGRHTHLRQIAQLMGAAVKLSQRAKTIAENALHLKSSLARQPTYDRAYPDKLSIASTDKARGATKPSLFLLFLQHDKNFRKSRQVLRKPNI